MEVTKLTARIKFITETSSASRELSKFGKSAKQVEAAQKRLVNANNRANEKLKDTVRSIKKSNASVETQKKKIGELNKAYANFQNSADNLALGNLKGTKAQNKFNNAVSEAKRQIADEEEALKRATNAAAKQAKGTDTSASAERRLLKTLNQAEQTRKDAIRSIQNSSLSLRDQRKAIAEVDDAYKTLTDSTDEIRKNTVSATQKQLDYNNSVREAKRGIQDANAAEAEHTKRVKESQQVSKQVTKNLNRLNQQRQDAIRSIQKSTLSYEEQEKAIGRVNKAFGLYQRNQVEAAKGTRRGIKAQNAFTNTLNETKRSLRDQAEAAKELREEKEKTNSVVATMVKNFDRLAGKFRVVAFTAGTLTAAVIGLATELEALGAIAAGVLVNIQFDTARQRLNSFNDSVQATRQQLDRFTEIAANAGVRITAVVDGMADFSAAAREAGLSLDQTNSILNAFTQAQSDFGGTSQEVNKNLENLAGLAKQGRLTMEDLRNSIEFTNDPVQVLANSFNKSEREIEKLIVSGDEFSTQVLLPLAKQIKNQTEASDGLAASFNRLLATVTGLVREFNQMGVIDSIIAQFNRLNEFLQTPAGAELITSIADSANHLINETLPNLVNSVRNNWGSILKTIKGVVGFLIGSAVGGAPGGLIGALIGAMGLGAETFGLLGSAAKLAATNIGFLTSALAGILAIGMTPIIASWASRLKGFAGMVSGASVAVKGLRLALGGIVGVFIFEGIAAIARAFGFMSTAAANAENETKGVLEKVKDLAESGSQSRINQFSRHIEEASKEQENLNKKLEETQKYQKALEEGRTNVVPPDALDGITGMGRLKEATQERIDFLQKEIEKKKEAKQIAREQIQEEEKRLKRLKESRDALENTNTDLSTYEIQGDPFADQVKGIENFLDRVSDLKQSISDIRVRISGGNVPEDLRKFTQDLEGLSRPSLRDVGVEMGLFSEGMNPQVLASRKQLIKSLREEAKRLLNVEQEEQTNLFMQEETESLRRQTKAYKAGEEAVKRYNIRKEIAAETGRKFADIEREQVTRLKQEKEAVEDAKREYERFQQMKEQLGQSVGDALTDAVVSANSLSEALNDLGKQIARIIMQKGVSEPLANTVSNAIGNMFGGGNYNTSTTGVSTGGGGTTIGRNAKGGIVNRTSAMMTTSGVQTMSENNKSEAILPLERQNGMLGVRSTGGESAPPIINIYNEGGGEAEVEESTDASGRSVVDIIIPAVQSGIQQGKLDGAMTKRFQGLQPRVKGR